MHTPVVRVTFMGVALAACSSSPADCVAADGGAACAPIVAPCVAGAPLRPADVQTGAALAPGSCWSASGDLVVRSGTLSVPAGVTITFAQGSRLRASGAGRINAVGTPVAPVVFQGVDDMRGAWGGVGFETNSTDNRLENVRIRGAGASAWTGDSDTRAALYIGREGGAALVNVSISKSQWYGLYLHGEQSRALPLTGLVVTESTRTARTHADAAQQIGADARFDANDENAVRLGTGGTDFLVKPGTWRTLSVPWLVVSKVYVRAAVRLEPGATFRFADGARITVDESNGNVGSFAAVGTVDAPIRFLADAEVPGGWAGLGFDTASASNRIEHASVQFGGRDAWTGNPLSKAAVFVGEKARLTLQDVAIANSAARGIHLYGGQSVVTCSAVRFEANAGANVGRGDANLDACP